MARLQIRFHVRCPKRKSLLIFLMVFSVVLFVGIASTVYLILIPAQKVSAAVSAIMATLETLRIDLESKSLVNLDAHVAGLNYQLGVIDAEVGRYDFLSQIEFTRGYYQNLQLVREMATQGQHLVTTALPELKVILKAAGYQVENNADTESIGEATDGASNIELAEAVPEGTEIKEEGENVQGIIRELPRLVKLYDQLEPEIFELIATFNKIDVKYVPAVGETNLQSKLITAKQVTAEFPSISAQLKQTLGILPQLLGSESPADYLVVYQNEKEIRASGGLLSAYGSMTIDKGELASDISATDMWDLEGYVSWTLGKDTGYRNIYGQNALMNSGCGSTYLRAQDAGIYPDLHVSLDMFKDYYDIAHKNNPKKYPGYDHVVIVNTFFASDIISLVEPLEVEGIQIDSQTAAKVIFGETSTQPFDPAIRKEFVGKVATALQEKFKLLSAADFTRVVQMFIRTAQAKNIAFYSKDAAAQAYFDNLGLSGRTEKNFAGDYFQLSEAQNCSLKSNFYLYDTVTQNINIDDAGNIKKDVSIEWVNEKVYDPKEPHVISNSASFRYRAWVRLYMPKGSDVLSSDGLRKSYNFYRPVEYFDEKMGYFASDNVIWFDHRRNRASDPIRKHTLNVSYTLPENLKYDPNAGGYRLLLQKHPGKKDERYIINIDQAGVKTSTEVRLDRDKVISYRDGVISVANYDTRLDDYFNLMESLKQ